MQKQIQIDLRKNKTMKINETVVDVLWMSGPRVHKLFDAVDAVLGIKGLK